MDVAIGQAVTMDDPEWRELLVRISDWKLSPEALVAIQANTAYKTWLNDEEKRFIKAIADYYQLGIFPEAFVSNSLPPLVTSELTAHASEALRQKKAQEDAGQWNNNQNQIPQGMVNMANL